VENLPRVLTSGENASRKKIGRSVKLLGLLQRQKWLMDQEL